MRQDVTNHLQNIAIRSVLGLALALPWRWRLKVAGALTSHVIAPLAGWRARIRENLALVAPDLPSAEVERLVRAVPANAGRTLIEIYSGAEFKARAAKAEITGSGMAALEAALARGQGVILVSGHFGNYDVPRAVLSAKGYAVAGLYRRFRNPYFTAHYERAVAAISEPIFPADGRRALLDMVRFLRAGGMLGMLMDVNSSLYPVLQFFGKPAATSLSAADMALKYDLCLVPIYGQRLDDNGNYRLIVEEPIPHSDAMTMTQALNDSLERQVRGQMDQWFWIHKRWKAMRRVKP